MFTKILHSPQSNNIKQNKVVEKKNIQIKKNSCDLVCRTINILPFIMHDGKHKSVAFVT